MINVGGYYIVEWGVDLGSVFSISCINIYYRIDNLVGMLYIIDERS